MRKVNENARDPADLDCYRVRARRGGDHSIRDDLGTVPGFVRGVASNWPMMKPMNKRMSPGGADERLRAAFARGEILDLRTGRPEHDDPSDGTGWTAERQVRADVITGLLCAGTGSAPQPIAALSLAGARVTGRLDLRHARIVHPLVMKNCYFDEPADFPEPRPFPSVWKAPGCSRWLAMAFGSKMISTAPRSRRGASMSSALTSAAVSGSRTHSCTAQMAAMASTPLTSRSAGACTAVAHAPRAGSTCTGPRSGPDWSSRERPSATRTVLRCVPRGSSPAGSRFGSRETACTGTGYTQDFLKQPDLRRIPRRNQGRRTDTTLQCKKSKIIFQDHNMPLNWENVELRGYEPLTSCMPYKYLPPRDMAGYGSTRRFNRCTLLTVA
jgi:hypothetical protein